MDKNAPIQDEIFKFLLGTIKNINTPIKRIGLLILLIGITLSIVGIFQINSINVFDVWMSAVFRKREYYAEEYWKSAWGFYLAIMGFLLSFAYDTTIAKIVKWVLKG